MPISEPTGQSLSQFAELGIAFLLSAVIGLEREIRHKSAGLRTYTVEGTAAALFLLISKYGFTNVLVTDRIVLDPSRVAAQIVTGISFIGAGLIFVRGDRVAGLQPPLRSGSLRGSAWRVAPVFRCWRSLPLSRILSSRWFFHFS
jgi:putative Mg2+ transporter-C (MgtC) family protein